MSAVVRPPVNKMSAILIHQPVSRSVPPAEDSPVYFCHTAYSTHAFLHGRLFYVELDVSAGSCSRANLADRTAVSDRVGCLLTDFCRNSCNASTVANLIAHIRRTRFYYSALSSTHPATCIFHCIRLFLMWRGLQHNSVVFVSYFHHTFGPI